VKALILSYLASKIRRLCDFVPVLKQITMKMYGEVEVKLMAFLTSALDVGKLSSSRSERFTSGKRARGNYWVGPTLGVVAEWR
jgi:hypothetical protein